MRFHYRIGWILINLFLKIFIGLDKQGREYIPQKGGALIASNHVDIYDPTLIGCASPREFYYLAKKELFNNPLFAWFIRKFNAIPISRGDFDRRGLREALEVLRDGKTLVVFPEGTRSKDGEFLEPKLGVAKLAFEAKVPVVPAYLDYCRNWIKALLQRRKIIIKFGPPIEVDLFSQIPKNKEGYRKMAWEIMQRIRALKEGI